MPCRSDTIKKIIPVVIGASTGGVAALYDVMPKLEKTDSCTVLAVIHMAIPEALDSLVKRLDRMGPLEVKIATNGMKIYPGSAYFMPCGYHGRVKERAGNTKIILNDRPKVNYVRPSVDVLMTSAAEVFKGNSVGIQLTGMGHDGAAGMKAIKDARGSTIAQNEKTSSVFSMPRSAIELDCVDKVLPLPEIAEEAMALVNKKS